MSLGLKAFWLIFLSALIAGGIALSTVGIPAPSVEVRKNIPIDRLLVQERPKAK
jgi:hypothetical protein